MINKKFEAYKLKRELKKSGEEYEIKRKSKNEFGEESDELVLIGTIKGLYHEENSSIKISVGTTTQFRNKKMPMVLCLFEDIDKLNLEVGDIITINFKNFKLAGIVNIQEWNLIVDVSLEGEM